MEHDVWKTPAVWRGVWVFEQFLIFFWKKLSCSNRKPFTLNRHTLWQTKRSIYKHQYITTYMQGAKNPAHLSSFKKEGTTPPKPNMKPENHREMRQENHHVQQIFIFWVPSVSLPGFFGGLSKVSEAPRFSHPWVVRATKTEVKSHFCYGKDGCFLSMDFFGLWVILDVLRKRWLEKMATNIIPKNGGFS